MTTQIPEEVRVAEAPEPPELKCYAYTVGGRHYLDSLASRGQIFKDAGGSVFWERRAALHSAQQGVRYAGEYGTHSAGMWRVSGVPCMTSNMAYSPTELGWTELPVPMPLEPDPLWLGQKRRLDLPCNKMTPAVNWFRALARHGGRLLAVEHERELVILNLWPGTAECWMGAWFPSGLKDEDLRLVLGAFLSGPPAGRDDDPTPPGMRDLLRRLGAGDAIVKEGHNIHQHYKIRQYQAMIRGGLMCALANTSLKEVPSWINVERSFAYNLPHDLLVKGWAYSGEMNSRRRVMPRPWQDAISLRPEDGYLRWEGRKLGQDSYEQVLFRQAPVWWPGGGLP